MTEEEILDNTEVSSEEQKETVPESASDALPAEDKEENTRHFRLRPAHFLLPAGAVLVMAIVLLFVLLLPENRVKRYTGEGNKAYAAGEFDKALFKYLKAVDIKENAYKAWKGALLSAAASGQAETRDELAHDALYSIADRGTEFKEEETKDAMELLLAAYEYLTDYLETGDLVWIRLESAYEALSKPGELDPMMAGYAYNLAKALLDEDKDPVLALRMFSEALKYSDGSETFKEDAAKAAERSIEAYYRAEDFQNARNILDTWGDAFDLDKERLEVDIVNAETIRATKLAFLSRVYDNMYPCFESLQGSFGENIPDKEKGLDIRMLKFDWFDMQNYDGSEAADALAMSSLEQDPIIFSPEGFMTEGETVACGIYPYGGLVRLEDGSITTSYYFFLGNYRDGKREGYGISFIRTGETSFYCFEGIWHNDAPNGYGILYRNNTYAHTQLAEYTDIIFGNFKDGYQDGTMLVRIALNEQPDTFYEGTYDVRDGYGVEVPSKTEDYELLEPIPEGYVLIGVIPSVSDGYSNYMIYRDRITEKKGSIGYN